MREVSLLGQRAPLGRTFRNSRDGEAMGGCSERCPMLQQTASRQLSIFLPVMCSRLRSVSATKLAALASRGAASISADPEINSPGSRGGSAFLCVFPGCYDAPRAAIFLVGGLAD